MGHLRPRMSHPASQLWISSKDYFTILHNERGQERHGNYINRLLKEILFVQFGTKMVWCPLRFESVFLLIFLNKRDQEVHEFFFF